MNGRFEFINGLFYSYLCFTAIEYGHLIPEVISYIFFDCKILPNNVCLTGTRMCQLSSSTCLLDSHFQHSHLVCDKFSGTYFLFVLGPFSGLINYDLKGKIGDSAWISEKFTAPENGSMCWKFIFSFSKCDPISRISRNLGIETWGSKFGDRNLGIEIWGLKLGD